MQIPKKKFQDLIKTGEYTLIDVRTSEEQNLYGVISDNQINIDISKPTAAYQLGQLSKTGKYLIYCWHGVRSAQIASYMKTNGFIEVYDLEGGIDVWDK